MVAQGQPCLPSAQGLLYRSSTRPLPLGPCSGAVASVLEAPGAQPEEWAAALGKKG